MTDPDTSSDPTDATTPVGPDPAGTAPQRQSAIDQTKDAAKRILATITGRNRS